MDSDHARTINLFLCGDVMTGRGIDQVLRHPGDPTLYESCVRDARDYVTLAEKAHGPIPREAGNSYIWGDALRELKHVDLRIINLETSITRSSDNWPAKGIHYRMHPDNIGCLSAAKIDACSLANNHTLDWGYSGLAETLEVLKNVGIACAGAGRDCGEAETPAILEVHGKGRVLLFACGSITGGVPKEWVASLRRSGLNVLTDLSEETAAHLASQMRAIKQPGDVAIISIHWGNNWDYEISEEETAFAHRLVDEGFDVVHGHSSHHVKALEIYRGRLILYGCGDFLTDYEGITGYEDFRSDLALMYLVKANTRNGELLALHLIPMQMRRFRLQRASHADASWLCRLLNKLGMSFGTEFELAQDDSIRLCLSERNGSKKQFKNGRGGEI